MNDLEYFKVQIAILAKNKGWADSEIWLERCLFRECGELIEAIENKRSPEEIAEEFADVMHFLLQIANKNCPGVDLNVALTKKIVSNSKTAKKTWVEGQGIVRV